MKQGHPEWEKLPNWKRHGRDRIREWARYRDSYTCRDCGKKWEPNMRSFDIHHVNGLCGKKSKGYDKKSDLNDLITLCHKCHYGRHDFSERGKKSMELDAKRKLRVDYSSMTNAYASALGKLGGAARAKSLTPRRRTEIARKAGIASGRSRTKNTRSNPSK